MRHAVIALLLALLPALPAVAQERAVGTVTRLQGSASTAQGAVTPGSPLTSGMVLTTGTGARAELSFSDGTLVVIGEHSRFAVESFAYDGPAQSGQARFRIDQGVFLVTTGAVAKLPGRPLSVTTPVASIGVRGTKFWGGSLDHPLDVLLLEGAITVRSPGGSANLDNPLEGTDVPKAGAAPSPVGLWKPERVNKALRSISFD